MNLKIVSLFSAIFNFIPWIAYPQKSVQSHLDQNLTTTFPAPIKDYGLKKYIYLSKNLPHAENATWRLLCQMPYNCHFQPWIRLKGQQGKVISLNSSNPLVLYLTKTEEYPTRPGDQTYEAKNWISGEGAIYTIPPGVTVEDVQYRETGYDTKFAGSFECSDNDYNILWKKVQGPVISA